MTYNASPAQVEHIAKLVIQARPSWDLLLVKLILNSHAPLVDGNDLAIAALRAAADDKLPGPKAIGWRGPHWRDLKTVPPDVAKRSEVCTTCGKPEPRCYSERPGPDDHVFEAARR